MCLCFIIQTERDCLLVEVLIIIYHFVQGFVFTLPLTMFI